MSDNNRGGCVIGGSLGFGSALAMAISFNVNHSIGWAILHGICSWFYIIYYAIWG